MGGGAIRRAGKLYGRWERPRNIAADRRGSIHDQDRAVQLGFRGALVSARVHMNVFVPVLLEAFGPRWFERGTISADFRKGTLDGEEVRAVVDAPAVDGGDVQVDVAIEDRAGELVAVGTASVGEVSQPTLLGARELSRYDRDPYDLVSNVTPGDAFAEREIVLKDPAARRMLGDAGVLPWYLEASPWGGPIASPSLMVNALGAACTTYLREHPVGGVAIDGGTELRNIAGPVFLHRPYRVTGHVLARGQSPRTEYFWYEGCLDDMQGNRVAEMLLQWRCAK